MSYTLGNILSIGSSLIIAKRPFVNQKIIYKVFTANDQQLFNAHQFSDEDGESFVAFDTSTWQEGEYYAVVHWEDSSKSEFKLLNKICFRLEEEGLIVLLDTDKTVVVSGETMTLTATVTTPLGNPKNSVSVTFEDELTGEKWTSVTNGKGIAILRIDTNVNDDRLYKMRAVFAGTASDMIEILVSPKIVLSLHANSGIYSAGEEAIFTATLTKGSLPFPDQTIKFTVE